MVDMCLKLCKNVSKFEMSDSKAGPGACPEVSSGLFLTNHLRDCSDFFFDNEKY